MNLSNLHDTLNSNIIKNTQKYNEIDRMTSFISSHFNKETDFPERTSQNSSQSLTAE